MSNKFSVTKTFWKGATFLLTFGIPYCIATYLQFNPEISALTVGTIATMVINYLKNFSK